MDEQEQYIYANYPYESRDDVLPIIDRLKADGINVIHGNVSEERVSGSSFVLNIVTDAAHSSRTYRKMLNYIFKHQKDMIQIHMDRSTVTSDVDGQLDIIMELFKYRYSQQPEEKNRNEDESSGQAVTYTGPDPAKQADEENAEEVNRHQSGLAREELYSRGMRLLKGNIEQRREGMQLLTQAANQGYAPAQYRLSVCYDEGTGVRRDPAQAARWREMAAYGGIVRAQSEMGYCYEYGQGVVRNIREAVRWYRIASEQGDIQAKNNLAYCYQKGRGVPKNNEQAIRLYTEAASGGHSSAQYNLGYCYWYGEGVPADKERAVKLFRESMKGGNAKAKQMMRVIEQYEYLHGNRRQEEDGAH